MKPRLYSDRAALSFAYDQTIDHFGMWILVVLIESITLAMRVCAWVPFLGMAGTSFFGTELFQAQVAQDVFDFSWFEVSFKITLLALALGLVFEFIGGIFDLGIMRIRFDLFETQKSSLSQILSCAHLAFKHFVATILYWGLVVLGLMAFVVPGVFFAIRFGFYRSVLIEKQCGPLAALRESFRLTRGSVKNLIVTYFLRGLLILPLVATKALPLIFFLTFPFLGLANIFVYKALVAHKNI